MRAKGVSAEGAGVPNGEEAAAALGDLRPVFFLGSTWRVLEERAAADGAEVEDVIVSALEQYIGRSL